MGWEFRILGDLEVYREGAPTPLGPPMQRSILGALLLNANQAVSLDRLENLLWDPSPPRSAVANLRTYASGLRPVLGERLVTRASGYQIFVQPGEFDLQAYKESIAAGRAAFSADDPSTAAARFTQALRLWRGHAGTNLPDGSPIRRRLEVLNEERMLVTEDLFAARLRLGEHSQLVSELRGFLSDHPLRERAWRHLILALYRSGDTAGALATFRQAASELKAELGLDPGPELYGLQQAILSGDVSLTRPAIPAAGGSPAAIWLSDARQESPAPRSAQPYGEFVPNQLPIDVAHLVGRDAELTSIIAACQEDRGARPVVAIVEGPAGVGKSVVAVRAARQLASQHPDGVLYVDLHGDHGDRAMSSQQLLRRLLRDLGYGRRLADTDDAGTAYRSKLAGRRVLIVLDGVTDPGQVLPVLPAEPRCTVLVTSNRRLPALDATLRVTLNALTQRAANALLVEFCGDDRIMTDPSGAAAVVDLCARLPLALRIAAARLANRPDWTPSLLAGWMTEERRRLDELVVDNLSMRTSIALSVRTLQATNDAWDRLAIRALEEIGALRLTAFDTETMASELKVTTADATRALERLRDAWLVEATGPETYCVPELVRLFAEGGQAGPAPPDRTDTDRGRHHV